MLLHELKNLKRFNEIIIILGKYGFGEIVDRLNVSENGLLQKINPVDEDLNVYQRMRLILEELGPTFIKFGQIMSLRPDLLPREFLEELSLLQDSAPEVDFVEVEKVIEASLGCDISLYFSAINREPLAAASISQVHLGNLRGTGERVAIKVQRPHIQETMLADLDILETLAAFLHAQVETLHPYDLPEIVKTVRRHLLEELDFSRELDNMNIARSYNKEGGVHIPEVHKELSGRRLLVMEYIGGTKFKNIASLTEEQRRTIAQRGLHAATTQILDNGFFHADPHPGNLIVGEDDSLCFIDWGMVGRLTDQDKSLLLDMLAAIVEKESESLAALFLRLCRKDKKDIDPGAFERSLMEMLERYHSLPLSEMNIGELLTGILGILNSFCLRLPVDYIIMIKALITADGSARIAYPELNVIEEVKGHVKALSRARYRPENLWKAIKQSFAAILAAKKELPHQVLNIVDKVEQGDIGVTFKLENLQELMLSLESASNRLTLGIITGSIIIGSSMIITTGFGPHLFGYSALGILGFSISVILGLWLMVTIIRNRKY